MNYSELNEYKRRFEEARFEGKGDLVSICKELLDKTLDKWLEYDEKGVLVLSGNATLGDVFSFLKSNIINFFHQECLGLVPDLSYKIFSLIRLSHSDRYKKTVFKITEDLKEYIQDNEFDFSNMSAEELKNYDGIITTYIAGNFDVLRALDKVSLSMIRKFLENVPESYDIRKSRFYLDCWLPLSAKDEKLLNLLPAKTKEEYEEYLFNAQEDKNGQVENFKEYDAIMYEYLMFYGKDQIPFEKKELLFEKIKRNANPGEMNESHTYSAYFSKDPSGIEVLNKNKVVVLKELAARIFESYGVVQECNPVEEKILTEALNAKDSSGKLEARKYISSLLEYGEDGVELAKYLIRVFEQFGYYNLETEGLFRDISVLSKDLHVLDALLENFNSEKLNDGLVDEKGLSRIDYADIALSIALEETNKTYLFKREDIQEAYRTQGRDIYDSRAVRTLVRNYLLNPNNYDCDENLEEIILKYVQTVVRKPDFDLFKEQEISDLLQLANTGRCNFAKLVEDEVKKGLKENPGYNMDFDKAREYVTFFMNTVGERPISVDLEDKVDVLLKALTVCRLNVEHGIFPQEFSDFLIRQALNKKSLLNIKSDKYLCVLERAFENLALNDCAIMGDDRKEVPLYQVRDYIGRDKVMGSTGANQVLLKRSKMRALYTGDLYALGTIYHENAHIEQELKSRRFDCESLTDYLIIKDRINSKSSRGYYHNNYNTVMHEIDAREKRK